MLKLDPVRKDQIQEAFRYFKAHPTLPHKQVQDKLIDTLGKEFVCLAWEEAQWMLAFFKWGGGGCGGGGTSSGDGGGGDGESGGGGATTVIITQANPALSSFPDAVNIYLCSFLFQHELKSLRATSPWLLESCGGKMVELGLRWDNDITGIPASSSTSLSGLLARQERREKLTLRDNLLLPFVVKAISHGHCRHLKELYVNSLKTLKQDLTAEQLTPLAAVISAGKLPNLEVLDLDVGWAEEGMAVLAYGLRNGACPKLESLGKFHRCNMTKINGYAGANMRVLAALVERCQELPGCSHIKELDGDLLTFGSDEIRGRLLRAMLPFIKRLPSLSNLTLTMARMIKERGAPFLEELQVFAPRDSLVSLPLIKALNSRA